MISYGHGYKFQYQICCSTLSPIILELFCSALQLSNGVLQLSPYSKLSVDIDTLMVFSLVLGVFHDCPTVSHDCPPTLNSQTKLGCVFLLFWLFDDFQCCLVMVLWCLVTVPQCLLAIYWCLLAVSLFQIIN